MRVLGDAAEAETMGQAGWTDYVMLQTLQLHRTAELALTRRGRKPSLPQHSYVLRLHVTVTTHERHRSRHKQEQSSVFERREVGKAIQWDWQHHRSCDSSCESACESGCVVAAVPKRWQNETGR